MEVPHPTPPTKNKKENGWHFNTFQLMKKHIKHKKNHCNLKKKKKPTKKDKKKEKKSKHMFSCCPVKLHDNSPC